MSRKIRIVRRKDLATSVISIGPVVRCCWCFTQREIPYNKKRGCPSCGLRGITLKEESFFRSVYVEDIK